MEMIAVIHNCCCEKQKAVNLSTLCKRARQMNMGAIGWGPCPYCGKMLLIVIERKMTHIKVVVVRQGEYLPVSRCKESGIRFPLQSVDIEDFVDFCSSLAISDDDTESAEACKDPISGEEVNEFSKKLFASSQPEHW